MADSDAGSNNTAEKKQKKQKQPQSDDSVPSSSKTTATNDKGDIWNRFEVVASYDAKKQSYLSYFTAILVSFVLVGVFYYLLTILVVCSYYIIVHGSLTAVAVLVAFIGSTYYPSTVLWQGFIDLPIWKCMNEYFSFRVIKPRVNYKPTDRFMFVEFPHGVFPLGFMLSATVVQQAMKGLRVEGAIATVLFRIPIMGHLCKWFGSRPATDRNIRKLLDRGSVGLMAGGIAEIFLTSPEHERVYVKNRRGFVKLALQTGTSLVPCYHFGNTQLFSFVGNELLSRRLRTSILLFYGRWFLPIPYQHPITMVLGEPIAVEKVAEPSREQIDELHAKFVAALRELFDTFKGEVGWAHKQLEIY